MALDRDAINTVTLRLLPPSAAPGAAVSSWLLWHTIPITASLSRTLSRLVSIEASAMTHMPLDDTADAAAMTRLTCSTAEAEKTSWIELARVGYVVSEIHAYCILLKCRRAAQAARLKAALEEGAALGLTAPVEYVTDARPVVVTHCAFAERRGRAEAVGADGTSITGHHLPRVRARWCTGDHMVSLWEAIATVYPVRGNGGTRQSPAASSAMRKGAAPPPSRHASAVTVAAAASTPKHTPLSSAKAAGRASPSRPPHTPPHLPLTGRGGRGGVDLGPLLSGDFCTICLDPLYLSACVTTLCQHSFHLSCYAQLPSGSAECPLCRFSVYDLLNDARCKVCGTYEDLWVCLICGHVACGRARRDHQQEHYHASGHSCSWQSTTNRMRNLSSRMFLHQEVALLLEEDGVDDAATADSPHSVGSATRLRSAEAGTSSEEAATTAMGGTLSPSDADRVRYMSWSDSLVDHDLQEALNESKEEAVAQYYTQFLRQLAEEQQRWYEARLAERRRCRRERQMATVAMAGGRRAESASSSAAGWLSNVAPSAHTALHRIAVDERRLRRRVLSEYVQATISLLQAAQREYAGMTHTLRAARDDAQQQVLLRSHFNSGLMAQVERVRQRTRELQRKGETAAQQKAAEEAELQRLVDEALSSL
ncbi:Zn-finger in ubiquitin-hydrolases and other family protein [Leishmania donovani]|uniref:Zn-finger in ubiquitin-hydrolases and other family protein n=1 Tax=Leishmania donovani TaxID=5661 RepID=A0A504XVK4_LEIDO|nr:Zn-finger in ubiquitin-hydrolases and other family protein [Leishmania donovani]